MPARLQDSRIATTAVNQHWLTPPEVLARIERWRPIGLDPCGSVNSRVPAKAVFRGPGHVDGLTTSWAKTIDALKQRFGDEPYVVFVNNPYEENAAWIAKCREEAAAGCEIVQLIPNRSDVAAWHTHVREGVRHIVHLKGRLSYGGLSAVQLRAVGILQAQVCGPRKLSELSKTDRAELEVKEKALVDHLVRNGPPPDPSENLFDGSGTAKFPSVLLHWRAGGCMHDEREREFVKAFGDDPAFGFVSRVCNDAWRVG